MVGVVHSLCSVHARVRAERGSSGSASMAAPARSLQRHEDARPRLHSSVGRPRDYGAVRGRTDRATSVHTCRHDTQDMHSSHEMCECATSTARCAAGEVTSVVHRTDGRREDEHDGLRPTSTRSGLPLGQPVEQGLGRAIMQ